MADIFVDDVKPEPSVLEACAVFLEKAFHMKREKLVDFFCDPDSCDKAKVIYQNQTIDLGNSPKPEFEDVLDYILDVQEESSVGEEAHNLFDKYSKELVEKMIEVFPEREILTTGEAPISHEVLKEVTDICGLSAKHSAVTLSNSHISVRPLMEVLSEEVIGLIQRRESLNFIDGPKPYLETALLNPKMPRQALAKAIQALMNKDWQIRMLRKFGESLGVKTEELELAILKMTKKDDPYSDLPQRPPVEKKGVPVSSIKRIKDQLSK